MIKAIKMDTSAMGGDSHVWIQGNVNIGPKRVIPISFAASQCPILIDKLAQIEEMPANIMDDIIQPTAFFVKADKADSGM